MKDAPEVSWHVKFDSQNLKHSGDLARWSTIIIAHHRPSSPMKVQLNPNITMLGIIPHSRPQKSNLAPECEFDQTLFPLLFEVKGLATQE